MYSYTFSNEDTKSLTEKTKKYSDLLDSFQEVDKQFSYDNDPISLERKTFTKPSEDQIKDKAEKSLYDYKTAEIKSIENDFDTKNSNIDSKIEQAKTSAQEKKEETKNMYQTLKQNASNDALKRGLSRSSIVINILDAFDAGMIDEINKINAEISNKMETLNNQKTLLTQQRQNALDTFDIAYAVKLSNKIDEINKELNSEEQKVLEYNNQIAQKEADYEAKRQQNSMDYAEFVEKYGENALNSLKQGKKYELAKEYLMGLGKNEALSELNSNKTFNAELGANYFNKLKVLINNRDE